MENVENVKLLEINSIYRNRTKNPNVGEFTLELSTQGDKNNTNAIDPISNMAPILSWNEDDVFDGYTSTTSIIPGRDEFGIGCLDGKPTFYPPNVTNEFVIGIPWCAFTSKIKDYYVGAPIVINLEHTNIIEMQYLGRTGLLDFFKPNIDPPLSNPPSTGDYITWTRTSRDGAFHIFGEISYNTTLLNYILWNETREEGFTIIGYDDTLRHVYLDTVAHPTVISTWDRGDDLVVRKTVPKNFGQVSAGTNTTTTVTLKSTSPSESDIYIGSFIRFTTKCSTTIIQQLTRRINSYDGATKEVTFSLPLPDAPTDSIDYYEILEYTRDNFKSIYNDVKWITRGRKKYIITLETLVLPNVDLVNGGRITSHPFVYVKLKNTNTSDSVLYSNNPNASNMLFKVIVSRDIWDPFRKPFVKLYCGMSQTIYLESSGSIDFGVYMSDGRVFQPLKSDWLSPAEPDKDLQISATFTIREF